jgi:hypothetical protein
VSDEIPKMILRDYLPGIYRSFLPEFFDAEIPRETLATCDDCIMLAPEKGSPDEEEGAIYYSPRARCCTYVPTLPNYLVGSLLQETRPETAAGRETVRALIRDGTGVFPQGIFPSPRQAQLYEQNASRCFGRSESLACPMLAQETGRCDMWPFRNAICCTWFCKYTAGVEGRTFWEILKQYLSHAEQSLCSWALLQLQWPAGAILDRLVETNPYTAARYTLSPEELDGKPPAESERRQMWGAWFGKEEELYLECARLVAALTPDRFLALAGVYHDIFLKRLDEARRAVVSPRIPHRLVFRPEGERRSVRDGKVRLNGFNGWLEIPVTLYQGLRLFDGRQTTDKVLAAIRLNYQVEVDPAVIIKLHQRRILLEVVHPGKAGSGGE